MAALEDSISGVRQALGLPRGRPGWGWLVRKRMSALKDALLAESARTSETWLTARVGVVVRERNALVAELVALGPAVLTDVDQAGARERLCRLLHDVERHRQRLSDLVYDSVALELGGSE